MQQHQWEYKRAALHASGLPAEPETMAEEGRFCGYAAVFDVVDAHRDVILKGAFAKSLAAGKAVHLLWQHEMVEPIGSLPVMREDNYGLYVEGRLLLDVLKGREAYSLMKNGVIRGLSIGFKPTVYRYAPGTGIRMIEEAELYEVSLVTFPANEQAQISQVKSGVLRPDMTAKTKKTKPDELDQKLLRESAQNGELIRLMDSMRAWISH